MKEYEALDIHLKRFETTTNAWLGQLLKAQKDIDYHGNVVSSFVGRNGVLSEQDRAVITASWEAITSANKRQDIAKRRLQQIEAEKQELLDLAQISKAKEFIKNVNETRALEYAPFGR